MFEKKLVIPSIDDLSAISSNLNLDIPMNIYRPQKFPMRSLEYYHSYYVPKMLKYKDQC